MMRCKYCGSTSIHSAIEHKNFSTGKALAGTIVFGPLGAGAGMLGKEIAGFRCTQCGGFMEHPMDTLTEKMVNDAIYSAKNHRSFVSYNYYKSQYPNIETVQDREEGKGERVSIHITENLDSAKEVKDLEEKPVEKRAYDYNIWDPSWPVYIRKIIIRRGDFGDGISFDIINQSKKTIRSLYLQVTVLDDTRDVVASLQCVYQGENVEPGKAFSKETMFRTGSDLAYQAEVICEKVSFTDDSVWRAEEESEAFKINIPVKINGKEFPRFGYLVGAYYKLLEKHGFDKEEIKSLFKSGMRPEILPEEHKNEGYWLCTCGIPVKTGHACPVCRCQLEEIQKIFSQQYLIEIQHKAVLDRAAKRAKETSDTRDSILKELEEIKEKKYQKAIDAKESTSITCLEEALNDLENLGDYRDANQIAEDYRVRIKEMRETVEKIKKAQEKKQQEEELKRRKEQELLKEEQEQLRKKKRTKIIIIAAVIIVLFAAIFKHNYDNPYRVLHRFVLSKGEREYSGSDTKRVKVEDNDVLAGNYTSYLYTSPKSKNPVSMEIWFDSPTYGNGCRADLTFDFSGASFKVNVDYMYLHTETETGHDWDYFDGIIIDGKIDLSKFDYINYDDSVSIFDIDLKDDYEDFDGLYSFLGEKTSDPQIKEFCYEASYLAARTLEKLLDENNINVTMKDLGFTSLEGSDKDSTEAADNKESGNQKEQSAYEKCKEQVISTGKIRSDQLFDGYECLIPVENPTSDYLQGSIGVTEDSDDLYILFEHHGTDYEVVGFRWKVRLDGEKGTYDLHLPIMIDGNKEFADLSGSFDLSTYDKTATYTAEQVTMEDENIDPSSIEGLDTYPTSMIASSISTLSYWLNNSKIGVSLEELGFR